MGNQKMQSALMEKEMQLTAANQSTKHLSAQLADATQLAEDMQRLLESEHQKTSTAMEQKLALERQLMAKQASIKGLQKQLDVSSQATAARVQELQGTPTLIQFSAH